MLEGMPDKAALVEQTKESILNLARFYQHQRHLEPAKATKYAIDKIISEKYLKPVDNLYLPKTIVEDGNLLELNNEYLNYNLSKLRADLIHDRLPDEINYDKIHSFGMSYSDERQSILDKRIREVLREGSFKLTPDQRHLYFVYNDENGLHNLLKGDGSLWHLPLTDLNNPPTSEEIMRRDFEDLNELLQKNNRSW
jgi:hypothetical protein